MQAIIVTGGKQYKVSEGDTLFIEKLEAEAGQAITFCLLYTSMDQETTSRMLHVLLALPQGVQAMNVDFPGLVQTSLNLGVMSVEEDGLHFAFSIRSCIASQKDMMEQRVRSVVEYAGGTAHTVSYTHLKDSCTLPVCPATLSDG